MTNSHRFITSTELQLVGISKAKLAKLFNLIDGGKRTKADIEKTEV